MAIPGGRLIRFTRRGAGEAELPGAAELLAALPTAMLMIDGDGMVRDCNPPAEALLNLSRSAVVGRTIEEMTGHPMTSIAPDQPIAAYDIDMVIPGRPPSPRRHHGGAAAGSAGLARRASPRARDP